MKEKNKKIPTLICTIFGILFMSVLVIATTTISDLGITTTGTISTQGYASQLMRVNDSVFETANIGIEYYSPNQRGGIYGTIYRQYFDNDFSLTTSEIRTGGNVTMLVDYLLHFSDGGNRAVGRGYSSYSTTADAQIFLSGVSGNGNLTASSTTWGINSGWVDYTK